MTLCLMITFLDLVGDANALWVFYLKFMQTQWHISCLVSHMITRKLCHPLLRTAFMVFYSQVREVTWMLDIIYKYLVSTPIYWSISLIGFKRNFGILCVGFFQETSREANWRLETYIWLYMVIVLNYMRDYDRKEYKEIVLVSAFIPKNIS